MEPPQADTSPEFGNSSEKPSVDINLVRFGVFPQEPCEDRVVHTIGRRTYRSQSRRTQPGRSRRPLNLLLDQLHRSRVHVHDDRGRNVDRARVGLAAEI